MTKPFVFISHRREAPWSDMTRLLDQKLRGVAKTFGYEVFLDARLQAGARLSLELEAALDATTHFIAMLCDSYMGSEHCVRELHWVIRRYEAAEGTGLFQPRLLFVRAGEMNPAHFTFEEARKSGALSRNRPLISKLSDITFLGPYDLQNVGQLEILDWENSARLDRQLGQLRDRFIATLPAP